MKETYVVGIHFYNHRAYVAVGRKFVPANIINPVSQRFSPSSVSLPLGSLLKNTDLKYSFFSFCYFLSGKISKLFESRQSLTVMNVPAICNCDLGLGSTTLKCKLILYIVILNNYVKLYQHQFTEST